jgi:probable rRNA maturation factor
LTVVVSDQQGRRFDPGRLTTWLPRVAPPRARGLVSIALVDDACIRALNSRYRRQRHATDVLSFPADSRHSSRRTRRQGDGPKGRAHGSFGLLGDIVIARGIARRQAARAGHSERTELRVLALHGLLHLVGYDHERDHGEMARLERRLRQKGGLDKGLIERA